MRPRPLVVLWALAVSMTAAAQAPAAGRESRRGTLLVAGRSEALPVLYVAAGTVTRVRFADLLAPRALPGPELEGLLEVGPLGEGSLVVSPVRNLAEGERLLLPVTGRTEDGEPLTLTLALVTRADAVDAEAWVARESAPSGPVTAMDEVGAVSRSLLASHGPEESPPRLALELQERKESLTQAGDVQAWVGSVLQMEGRVFLTVRIQGGWRSDNPWRLIRARLEVGCGQEPPTGAGILSLRITSRVSGRSQLHTFTASPPAGTGCLSLTLEEDGPRTLRFKELEVSP